VLQVQLVLPVLLGLKVRQVLQVLQVLLDQQALLDLKELLDPQVLQVLLDPKVQQVQQDRLVQQVLTGPQGTSAATAITNNTNNYIVTATGNGPTPFNGESSLTFDGTKLTVTGNGGTVLDVQGSAGQLFSVTDSLTGTLFSVNDATGIPILSVEDTDNSYYGYFWIKYFCSIRFKRIRSSITKHKRYCCSNLQYIN